MSYRYLSIMETDADIVVCPTAVNEEIASGSLHEEMVCELESGYIKKHFDTIQSGIVKVGHPIFYYIREGDWAGRWVLDLPVTMEMSFVEFRAAVQRCLTIAKETNADVIAVPLPMPGVKWSEELQEFAWTEYASIILAGTGLEVEFCTREQAAGADAVVDVESNEVAV